MGSAVLGEAISAIRDWSVVNKKEPGDARAANLFGSLVFNDAEQEKRLPKPAYHALRRTITHGQSLDASVADAVASALKDWAVEHGATHYTHWFQPLTGITAEKHDSVLEQQVRQGHLPLPGVIPVALQDRLERHPAAQNGVAHEWPFPLRFGGRLVA